VEGEERLELTLRKSWTSLIISFMVKVFLEKLVRKLDRKRRRT